jgi:hypothetical protein
MPSRARPNGRPAKIRRKRRGLAPGPAGPRTRVVEPSTRARAGRARRQQATRSRDRLPRRSRQLLAPDNRLPLQPSGRDRRSRLLPRPSAGRGHRSRRPTEASHTTEVTREHGRVSALPLRTNRETRADWVAAAGSGVPHRRQPYGKRHPDADRLERDWGRCGPRPHAASECVLLLADQRSLG